MNNLEREYYDSYIKDGVCDECREVATAEYKKLHPENFTKDGYTKYNKYKDEEKFIKTNFTSLCFVVSDSEYDSDIITLCPKHLRKLASHIGKKARR